MQGKITKRLVDSLTIAATESFLWDSEVKGFGLKVTPTGKRVYLLQYRQNGRVRRFTIGLHGSPWTPEQARTEAVRLLGLVVQGEDPAEAKQQAKNTPIMAEICDTYLLEGTRTKKPSSVAIDRGHVERHIKPLMGRKRVDQITQADVQRCMIAVADGATAVDVKTGPKGRAIVTGGKVTANRVVALLGSVFAFAISRGLRKDNPAHGIKKFREQPRERFLTGEEVARLGNTLRELEEEGVNSSGIAAVRLLLLTGMRRGEVLSLEWSQVDFERACLRLPDSKTGQKVVHVGAAAMELLTTLPRIVGQPFCFPGAIHGKHLVGLTKIWGKIRERADISDIRIHDTRHCFASVGVTGGMGLPIVGALLGHTQARTTQRYAHLSADPLKAAANTISGQIAAVMSGGPKAEVVSLHDAKNHANQGGGEGKVANGMER